MGPTPHDVIRLAARAFCDTKTVRRYYANPAAVRSTSAARIAKAARDLGLPLATAPAVVKVTPATGA